MSWGRTILVVFAWAQRAEWTRSGGLSKKSELSFGGLTMVQRVSELSSSWANEWAERAKPLPLNLKLN